MSTLTIVSIVGLILGVLVMSVGKSLRTESNDTIELIKEGHQDKRPDQFALSVGSLVSYVVGGLIFIVSASYLISLFAH